MEQSCEGNTPGLDARPSPYCSSKLTAWALYGVLLVSLVLPAILLCSPLGMAQARATRTPWQLRLPGNSCNASPANASCAQQQLQQQQQQHASASGNGQGGASTTGSTGCKLFVGVLSASGKRARRDAIRAGWGSHPALSRLRFFMARPANDTSFAQVQQEATSQGDIVILLFVGEHYDNIPYQTLEAFRLAAADPAVTHVLKTDDDTYVRIDPLIARLAALPQQLLYLGRMEYGYVPIRKPSLLWYVSTEEWPHEVYPPWAHGAGYVLSVDLARRIASGIAAKTYGGRLFRLEDVGTGIWVQLIEQELGHSIARIHEPRFNHVRNCRSQDLVMHYISPAEQLCLWEAGGRCNNCRL